MNNIFDSIKQLEEHIFINKLSETDYEYLVLPIPRGSKPSDTRHSIALLYDGIFNRGEPVLLDLIKFNVDKDYNSYTTISLEGIARGL